MVNRIAVLAAVLVALVAGIFIGRASKSPPPTPPAPAPSTTAASAPTPSPPPALSPVPVVTPQPRASRGASPPKAVAGSAVAPAAESDGATLVVRSDVPGAQVFLNREYLGTTPFTATNLKPGTHRLNVSAEGFDGYAETLELTAGGREIDVSFKTVRLDAAIDVVHNHRIGSCRGRLVATPDRIRYVTSDEDAFSVELGTLQTFELDYVRKNMRIQPRNGRRYDFSDAEGNADRLFVFHRDVQKVRDRMKGPN